MAEKQRLTSEYVDRLEPPASGHRIAWDVDVAGFGARVTAAGVRAYILNYRTRAGRQRRITLGRASALTASQARKLAKEELGKVAAGTDPQ
ncbi:MAG TPA: Arm DNA-binding domain-containing protein, partial [Thermoanaerobaculia bacterium]|nr:Arm DNA-binding domain-containing protein [Thermoanaerobaculia bacterium]